MHCEGLHSDMEIFILRQVDKKKVDRIKKKKALSGVPAIANRCAGYRRANMAALEQTLCLFTSRVSDSCFHCAPLTRQSMTSNAASSLPTKWPPLGRQEKRANRPSRFQREMSSAFVHPGTDPSGGKWRPSRGPHAE